MPTALLVGAYGQGSLGDDALLDAFLGELRGWDVTVTALDPTAVRPGCTAVPRRPLPVLRALRGADAVVFGGGTIFKQLHPSTGRHPLALLLSSAALVTAAKARGRPVAVVGVGAVSPAGAAQRALTRRIARHADLLVVRDEESARHLVSAGVPGPVRVGADAAWVLFEPPVASGTGRGDRVVLVPSRLAAPDGGDALTRMVDRLARAVVLLGGAGWRVEVRSWERAHTEVSSEVEPAPRDDALVRTLAERLEELGGSHLLDVGPTPPSLAEAVGVMRDARAVLTYRFHGLVAAGAAGVPAVAVAHEPKLAGLARRLGQRTLAPDADAAELAAAVLDAVGSNGPDPGAVKQEIVRAEEGFRLLRVLLACGATDESDGLGALPLVQWS